MILFHCESCRKKLSAREEQAGRKVKCPACGAVSLVKALAGSAAPSAKAGLDAGKEAPTIPPTQPSPEVTQDQVTQPPPSTPDATKPPNPVAAEHDISLTDFLSPPQTEGEIGWLGGFRILNVLGHGGMGVVFQGEDPKLGRLVAIKAMLPHLLQSKTSQQRFLREARSAAALEHDHIVAIHHVGEDRGAPFIVMPFLKGESLESRLQREGKLSVAEVLRIGRETAEGLAAAHRTGMIHRDIKPANIWLQSSGGISGGEARGEKDSGSSFASHPLPLVSRVKILDFGLARAAAEQSGLTQQGMIVGTPTYMAPEQGRGVAVDARCDLWSLGVVLYRMCTGDLPFKGTDTIATLMEAATHQPPPPRQLNPAIPAELSDLVMRLLAKDPDARLARAEEVVVRLRELEAHAGRESARATVPIVVAASSTAPADDRPRSVVGNSRAVRSQPTPPSSDARLLLRAVPIVFGLTIFVSSTLLFLVQPMVGKLLTARLGGTPAVWNTCLVFFQGAVLAGYFYAFLLHLPRGRRWQSLVHLALVTVALPAAIGGLAFLTATADTNLEASFVWRTLALLVVTLGLPVLVLAATAPLLQQWLATTSVPIGNDPYRLYGAGSLGAMCGLATYPVWLEPNLGLSTQFVCWTLIFLVLGALVAICVALAWLAPPRSMAPAPPAPDLSEPLATPGWADRLRWLACAALPASLLMGFTTHVTTDLAPTSLFWTMPLALFLFTIVLSYWTFTAWAKFPFTIRIAIQCGHGLAIVAALVITLVLAGLGQNTTIMAAVLIGLLLMTPYAWIWVLQPIAVVAFFLTLDATTIVYGPASLLVQLLCFFVTLRICHQEMAHSRPATPYLTEYYLWIGAGGMLGGLFNMAVAPFLFRSTALEYPLVMVLASALRPPYLRNGLTDWFVSLLIESVWRRKQGDRSLHRCILAWACDLILPIGAGVVLFLVFAVGGEVVDGMVRNARFQRPDIVWQIMIGGFACAICLIFVARPVRFTLCLLLAVTFHALLPPFHNARKLQHLERTAFGIVKVHEQPDVGRMGGAPQAQPPKQHVQMVLMHGTTLHGFNYVAPGPTRLATTYYHRDGPLGHALERYDWFHGPADTYAADVRGPASLLGQLAMPTVLPIAPLTAAAVAEPPVAVLGLGTGSVASYARPMQRMDFYELDPAIIRLCESKERPAYFRFVEDARKRGADVRLFAGDGRLSLKQRGPTGYYKVIVIDAFASDAIPIHLLTLEAFQLYLDKLAPDGIICVHTSNRYIDLPPVLADTAGRLGLVCTHGSNSKFVSKFDPSKMPMGMFSSEWVVLAGTERDLPPAKNLQNDLTTWDRLSAPGRSVWTDDLASLSDAFRPDIQVLGRIFTVLLFTLIGLTILHDRASLMVAAADAPPSDATQKLTADST